MKGKTVESLKINLGCGCRKLDGYKNIDIQERFEPDIVCDVLAGLPYQDSSVDEVRAFDFLEHIPLGKTIGVIEEIWRVLKPDGLLEHFTPSTDGKGAFCDPTHVSFWNLFSWRYFVDDDHRGLYDIQAKFRIVELRDILTSKEIIHTYGRLHAVK